MLQCRRICLWFLSLTSLCIVAPAAAKVPHPAHNSEILSANLVKIQTALAQAGIRGVCEVFVWHALVQSSLYAQNKHMQ